MNSIFMDLALKEAMKAYKKNEIPVGAIIIKGNEVIAKGFNNRQKKNDVFGHAEIICVKKAQKKLKDWRLNGCEMYVTLKPCDMCSVIINEARISKIYFLVEKDEQKKNYQQTKYELLQEYKVINKENYLELLRKFFIKKR